MFERFTERARQVVVLAQDESRSLKHNYIGTEHLLLGLLREEEGLAARVLDSLEVTVEEVRAQVAGIVGLGDEVVTGRIPFTPRAKHVLELALPEGLSIGHNYVGTEHILLGLVRENKGVAARILVDFGADADTIRNEIIGVLSGSPEERAARSRRGSEGWVDQALIARVAGALDPRRPRLTRPARTVLVHAQQEARAMQHVSLDCAHILLGLLREGHGLAARLLDSQGVTLDGVRAAVIAAVGQGSEEPAGHIPFSAPVQEMLETARNEALSLDHDYVGTEHLLLALMLQGDGVAAQLLREQRS